MGDRILNVNSTPRRCDRSADTTRGVSGWLGMGGTAGLSQISMARGARFTLPGHKKEEGRVSPAFQSAALR